MTINHNPHTPEAKLAKAKMLRRTAELRRQKASATKDAIEFVRLRNEATELERHAAEIESEVRNMVQGDGNG